MKALRFESGSLKLAETPVPRLPGEALVRVALAGICSTDLHITRGYAAFSGTLGHEFVGVVEESPDTSQIGRRVVGEINAGCGNCDLCRSGDSRHCLRRTVLGIHGRDGAFAEYLNLPAVNLLPVPDTVSDRQAVFTEPLAAAFEILAQVEIGPSDRIAVIGDGKLGQLIARVLAGASSHLILIGKHDPKLQLARAAAVEAVHVASLEAGTAAFDVVVEASGSPSGLTLAQQLVRPRGTIVLKSTFHGQSEIDASAIVVNEVTLVGSRCGRFAPALEALASGKVDVEPLIEREYALEDGIAAMIEAASPGMLKVLLVP
jgi:threonine dehydrogenase-like Zn-dependent dehydrogenase